MLVPLLYELVCPRDEGEGVDVVELGVVRIWLGWAWMTMLRRWEEREEQRHTSPVTLDPNNHPAPRGLTAHVSTSSGSDHIKSQNGPSCGTSCARDIVRTWSSVRISGDRPPWTQRMDESMI